MANRRMISAGIFEDEFTGQLTLLERVLWIGLITSVADDQGRLYDSTALIRARIFLYDDINDDQVETALEKLAQANKIIRYKSTGKNLIQIVKWWVYQTPSWASASKYAAPDNWVDRSKYHTTGNKVVTENWDKVGGLHSELHSKQPTSVDSAINDYEVNVKEEGEFKPNIPPVTKAQIAVHKSIEGYFVNVVKMKKPNNKKAYDEWTDGIADILVLTDFDDKRTKELIEMSVKEADKDGLTIVSPKSLVKMIGAIVSSDARKINRKPAGTEFDPNEVL